MSGDLSSGSISWGPEIVVDGVKPNWLENSEFVLVNDDKNAGQVYGSFASGRRWPNIATIRLRADHPHYAQKVEKTALEWFKRISENAAQQLRKQQQALKQAAAIGCFDRFMDVGTGIPAVDAPPLKPAIDWNGPLEAYHPDGRTIAVDSAIPSEAPGSEYWLQPDSELPRGCPYAFRANGSPYVGSRSEWRVRNRVEVEEARPVLKDEWFGQAAAFLGDKMIRPEMSECDALVEANAKIRKLKRKLRKARATIDRNAAFADRKIDELADKLAEARTYTPEQAAAAREELVFAERRCLLPEQIVDSLAVKLGLRKAPSAAQEN